MGLQDHHFKQSQYERPTQDWVCGWAHEGWTCPVGPRIDGTCRAKFECYPIRKLDRWYCTRSDYRGGSCQNGPLPDGTCCHSIPPCQPILSLRRRRGAVSFWTIVATLGILFIFLPGSHGPAFISSGDLTHVHGTIAKDCGACHTTSHQASAVNVSIGNHSLPPETDSRLCLKCHQFGESGMATHSRAPETLRASTERMGKTAATTARPISLFFLDWLPGWSPRSPQLLTCGTCHQEHRGKDFHLQAMDNQTCQGCHTLQFVSFADGHPELTSYPYERRTRIAFDHKSHLGKYFSEKKDVGARYSNCASCHSLDQVGHTMLLAGPFRKMCAECHTQELKGIGLEEGPSIPFFRLPELDKETLDIGEWPSGLYGLDQGITPYMQILMEATAVNDPELAKTELAIVEGDFSIIENHGGLYDLRGASPEIIEAATRISWAIKGLLFDLIARGQKALISRLTVERMQRILGQPLNEREISALAGQVPVGVIRTAQRKWFPNLRHETASRKGGLSHDLTQIKEGRQTSDRDERSEKVSHYTPSMTYPFSAAAPVSSFLEHVVENRQVTERRILEEGLNPHVFLVSAKSAGEDTILDELDDSILDLEGTQDESELSLTDDLDELNILEGQNESEAPQHDSKGEDLDMSILESQDIITSSEEDQEIDLEQQQRLDKERESGVIQGGWFLQESDFSIRYRRAGHNDMFFQAWLDATRQQSDLKAVNPAAAIFQNLSGRKALESDHADVANTGSIDVSASLQAGGCMRCHSVDTQDNGKSETYSHEINWSSFRPTPNDHPFTHFRHASHLSLVQDEGACKTCHQMKEGDQEGWTDRWFGSSTNPRAFASNFTQMAKKSCATCHEQDLAGDSCLLCHNYHVGNFPTSLPSTQNAN